MSKTGLTRSPTEEEDGRERRKSIERDKGPHYRWVNLSDDRRGKMGKDSDNN